MSELRFDGSVAVITGGGGGLGRCYALLLASRGCRVVVNDASVKIPSGEAAIGAEGVVAEIRSAGGDALADDHDVVTAGPALIKRTLDAYGRVDILINNAGIAGGGPIAPDSPLAWHPILATTLDASIAVTGAAWPHLVEGGRGRVVFTASAAMFGAPGTGAYSTAKSAMFGLTRSLAGEGRRANVAVNCIMPSAVTRLTRMLPPGPIPELLQRHYPPEAVASFVVWLCHPNTPITGETFSVGGGRAARVVLAENPGVRVDDLDPGSWALHLSALMDTTELGLPRDMNHEVSWQALHLGKDVPAEFHPGGKFAWD